MTAISDLCYPLLEEVVTLQKKKVRRDEVFSNMSAPELVSASKPVIYQEPVAGSKPATEQNQKARQSTANKKVT